MTGDLVDAADQLNSAAALVDGIFMAASDLADRNKANAIQAVAVVAAEKVNGAMHMVEGAIVRNPAKTPANAGAFPLPLHRHHYGMSARELYTAINAIVLLRQMADLQILSSQRSEPAIVHWAEDIQEMLDAELDALAKHLQERANLSPEETNDRDMALARASGLLTGRSQPDAQVRAA